jgi:hypothetical protein
MNTGMMITLMLGTAVLVVSVVTVFVFRWITKRLGTGGVVSEGAILGEDGLEVPGLLFLHKKVIGYSDVKSVELLSGSRAILFIFKISVHWICPHPFSDIVAIELKSPPQYYKYLVVAPREPLVFVKSLEEQIQKAKASPSAS